MTPETTLTDGSPVTPDHRDIDPTTGMQKGYVVLSEAERAKGFVRPVRHTYVHTGASICAKALPKVTDLPLGGKIRICALPHGHSGECGVVSRTVSRPEWVRASDSHRWGGCGVATKMGQALAETYARDPKFYGGTYCVGCKTHHPVGEFEWNDGAVVGS